MLLHDQKIMTMFDMALSFLYDSQLDDARIKIERRILQRRAENDAREAASWVFDGNTTEETYKWVQKALDEGDPEVYDKLPNARLGGEFAGDPTFSDILKEELGREDDGNEDDLYEIYIDTFNSTVVLEVEKMIASHFLAADLEKIANEDN